MKNIETNEIYIRELLQSCDILAIQEHWLFSFQLGSIEIDYILFNKAGQDFVKSVSVKRDIALNASDHVRVIAQLEIPVKYLKCGISTITRKPN